MPKGEKVPFFEGKVRMEAYEIECDGMVIRLIVEQVFDHGTNQGRLAVRNFVHEHLCLGHRVTTIPL